jgi:two-component system invasion response regulator UvrY
MKISILIAEDFTLVRHFFRNILNADDRFHVVAECDSGEKAVQLAQEYKPNIAIVDINLVGMNGLDATRQIKTYSPDTKVICMSGYNNFFYIKEMFQNGAMGYVTKNSKREEIYRAVQYVMEGKKYLCEDIKDHLIEQAIGPGSSLFALTSREMQICTLIQKGHTLKEIGDMLTLSSKTVQTYKMNILQKLNLENSDSLMKYMQQYAISR